jgi:hypothetical protein
LRRPSGFRQGKFVYCTKIQYTKMGKRIPIDPGYNYTGDELDELRQRQKAISYSQNDIEREAAQIKKRLEELRDRWKLLGMEKSRIEAVLREMEWRMRNVRR